jgi:hypothetical protein
MFRSKRTPSLIKANEAPTKGYNPFCKDVSRGNIECFGITPMEMDLNSVPGISKHTISCIGKRKGGKVTNTFQLLAKYMSFKQDQADGYMVVGQRMYDWLKSKGVNSHRSSIVLAMQAKTERMFIEFFDTADPSDDATDVDDASSEETTESKEPNK